MTKRWFQAVAQQQAAAPQWVTFSQQQQQPNQEPSADPAGDPDPGTDPDPAGDPLGPAGEATLRKEREERKRLERELKAMKAQLSPEARQAAEERLRAAEEAALRAQEEADKKAKNLQTKYERELQAKAAALEAREQEFTQYKIRTEAQRIYQGTEGLDGISEDGTTSFFDLWFAMKGGSLRYDDSGQLMVVDGQGDPLLDSETGKRVNIKDWVKTHHNDPVLGALFKPAYGSGSGARSTRDGRALPGQKLSIKDPKSSLFEAAFGGR